MGWTPIGAVSVVAPVAIIVVANAVVVRLLFPVVVVGVIVVVVVVVVVVECYCFLINNYCWSPSARPPPQNPSLFNDFY